MFEGAKDEISAVEARPCVLPQSVTEYREESSDEFWVGYPAADEILGRMASFQAVSPTERGRCLLIVGDASNGKTSILRRFLDLNPPLHDLEHGVTIPTILLEIPPALNERRFVDALCESLFIPYDLSHEGKKRHVYNYHRRELADILAHVGLRTLLMDDLHDVTTSPNDKLVGFFALLEEFSKRGINLVATADTSESDRLLQLEPVRHLFEILRLPRWKMDVVYSSFLGRLERTVTVRRPSSLNLTDHVVAEAILKKADGSIGRIASIARTIAMLFAGDGREVVTRKTISNMLSVVAEYPPSAT